MNWSIRQSDMAADSARAPQHVRPVSSKPLSRETGNTRINSGKLQKSVDKKIQELIDNYSSKLAIIYNSIVKGVNKNR